MLLSHVDRLEQVDLLHVWKQDRHGADMLAVEKLGLLFSKAQPNTFDSWVAPAGNRLKTSW